MQRLIEGVTTRWMKRSDLTVVKRIEVDCFDCPWMLSDFLRALRNPKRLCRVVTIDRAVIGYCVWVLGEHEVSIENLAIDPAYWRQGFGSRLVERAQEELCLGRTALTAWTCDHNLGSHLFFRSLGFRATQIRKKFFTDDSDGYLMSYDIWHR